MTDYVPDRTVVADLSSAPFRPGGMDSPRTAAQPDPGEVEGAVGRINDTVQSLVGQLEFSIDTDTQRTVVKVVDTRTKQVLRQFPSEEVLQIAKALDNFTGLLLKDKA